MDRIGEREADAGRTMRRRRRRLSGAGARLQIALGWGALAFVLAAVLRNGATAPVVWTALCLATLLLFAVQAALDLRHGLPRTARAALWLALPYFTVLVWLQIQSTPGVLASFAHPVWTLAPEGARPAISANPDGGRQVVMRLACYAMVFWILLRSAGSAHRGGAGFVQAFALFSTALALYGLVSKSTGYNLLLDASDVERTVRASFWNRNTYATVAVFGVLANLTAYFRAVSGVGTGETRAVLRDYLEAFFSGGWLYAFGALIGLAALAMTLSRAGALAAVVGISVLIWALRRGRRRVGAISWAIPLALVAFVALFMTSGVIERVDLIGEEARPALYRQTVAAILDRPLLGHGAGAFPEAFRAYAPLEFAAFEWSHAHNSYLDNAFEFGLPAAAVFFFALALIGARLLSGVLRRRRHQEIPAFALACFVSGGFHAVFDFSLQIPAVAALFAAILGLGWAQSYPSRHRPEPANRSDTP